MKKNALLIFWALLFGGSLSLAQANKASYSIVVLGDSITEGYGLDKSKAYPQILTDLFHKDKVTAVQFLNAGISGSTSSTALQRLKWFLKSKPDMLILAMGANDGLRGIPTKTLEKNLNDTIELAKTNKLQVVLVGMMMPPNYGEDYRKNFQKVYKDLAKKHSVEFIPFLLNGVAGDKSLNQEDGIHPNEKGQQKIADNLYKDLKPIISSQLEKKK